MTSLGRPDAATVLLVRSGTPVLALAVVTAVAAVIVTVATGGLVSASDVRDAVFWLAIGAVPGGVAVALWRQHLKPAPRLILERDDLVVDDPLTLAEPLRVPWGHVASVRAGTSVDGALADTIGGVLGLHVPRSAEYGLDVGSARPNLVLAFDPPVRPPRSRRVLVGRGTRTVPPDQRFPITRLWLVAADVAAAREAFVTAGRLLEEGD